MTGKTGPLAGIRILEFSHMLAGPYAGLLLADLGAEVIKVEGPDGDLARDVGPHYVGRHNVYFAAMNRNKKSVVVDLATPEGQSQLRHLVKDAHAILTNYRPSAVRKLGLDYESLRRHNPQLACVALTGYGMDGEFAHKPAYDYVIQALVGIAALTGEPDGPPTKVGFSTIDNAAGMMAALGLLAKIVEGKGGQVDISMYDITMSQMNYLASTTLHTGDGPKRFKNGAHPYIVPAQMIPTSDGHLAVFISHDGFWKSFAAELGQDHWLTDPRFATMQGRAENRDLVIDEIEALLKTLPTKELVDRLDPLGIVVAGVQDLKTALDSDLTAERGLVQTVETQDGPMRLLGPAIHTDGTDQPMTPPPTPGQHNDEYLMEPETA